MCIPNGQSFKADAHFGMLGCNKFNVWNVVQLKDLLKSLTKISMMYYYGNYFGPMMFGFGMLWNLLFWAGLIYLVFLVFSRGGRKWHDHGKAMEILKERYAKGEITKEQFESMKKDLE